MDVKDRSPTSGLPDRTKKFETTARCSPSAEMMCYSQRFRGNGSRKSMSE